MCIRDRDNTIYPGATEIPDNGIDENCDGVDGYLGLLLNNEELFKLYPNPVNQVLFINGPKIDLLKVVDISGKIVAEIAHIKSNVINLDVSNLENGVYFVLIESGKTSQSLRFIKN